MRDIGKSNRACSLNQHTSMVTTSGNNWRHRKSVLSANHFGSHSAVLRVFSDETTYIILEPKNKQKKRNHDLMILALLVLLGLAILAS